MNKNPNNEEINVLYFQILLSTIFLSTILFSIFSTYNEVYNLKFGERIIPSKIISKLTKLNRFIGLLLLFGFLYVNYKTKEFDSQRGRNIRPDNLSILASYISIIAGIITLYIVIQYGEDAFISGENPET